jgi:YfiH family protein
MEWFEHCIVPAWPAPPNVKSLQTTRIGGISCAPYDTFNLGDHVGDEPLAVAHNRQLFSARVPSEPLWLKQVHGTTVVNAAEADCVPTGDASVSRHAGAVCAVMTADCLPILLCDTRGTVVGAAHAGWRGLCDGVIESTVASMRVAPEEVMAWLGPAIGAEAFEVGEEVRAAFIARQPEAERAFKPGQAGKWLADIVLLARQRLQAFGVSGISGGEWCTYSDPARFYSYRRDGVTGRMASLIWLEHQ